MEWVWNFAIWSIIILSPALVLVHSRRRSKLPPGPPGWPVLGHIFSLGNLPHRKIASLKQKYGPVVWLKLASVDTMVIQTSSAAAEFFKNHDVSFADRTVCDALRSQDFHKSSMALAPYGTYWLMLRRMCTVEMLTTKRINEAAPIREKCVHDLLSWVEEKEGETREPVQVSRLVFLALFNMFGNLILSRDLVDPESKVGSEFFIAVGGIVEWIGIPNISDFFPILNRFDLQGIRKKMDRDLGKTLEIVFEFVKQRIKQRAEEKGGERVKDFLDVLLDFQKNEKDESTKLSDRDINVFILEMFIAGAETTSNSVEWAMTELLCNPKAMMKVKAELTKIVGPNKRLESSDIDKLQYLQAVIKESLRIHPPSPFLVPRRATQDVNFMGYRIPKTTQVFVNVWAIGRDPDSWEDPLSFKPERFLGSKIDFNGQHFELIPFGAGRRICPGFQLAHHTLPLLLGSLLHEFDWELESHVSSETMDMKGENGVGYEKIGTLESHTKKAY